MEYTLCKLCNSNVTKSNILKHQKTEICQKIKNILIKKENDFNTILKLKEEEYNENLKNELKEKLELQSKLIEFENKVKILESSLISVKNELLSSDKKSEEYRKIIEKCASKSTTTNVVNNKNTYNNHLNYISSEPINFKDLKHNLSKIITVNSMLYDDDAFNNHIINNILRDENGKDKVLCTDINRKNFSYKDELSGELISDPELEKLREKLRNGVDIKIVRNELLYKLIDKYRDRTDIDPYEKLCYFLEKLEFGDPFVVQVAKKTYIKSKPSLLIE
jgi:hypothetical protein